MKTRTSTVEHLMPCRHCINTPVLCDRIIGRKPIVLVLDYPTQLEAKKGKLLQGDTGRLIRSTLKAMGVDDRDVNVITALNCKPVNMRPKHLRETMQCCRARLLRELRSLNAEKIMCLGPISYTALTSTDKIARMDKVHGRWMHVYGMKMIGTYSPTRVIMDAELFRDWIKAFTKFFHTDGREPWPEITYSIPESLDELYEDMLRIGAFTEHQLSCDIETTGFSPLFDSILAIGFGSHDSVTNDGHVVIITQELLEDKLTWNLIADQLRNGCTSFHNGKFDLKFFITVFNNYGIDFVLNNIDDTMLLNYSLDERPWGRYGAHSLKNVSRVRYDAPAYDIDMGKWLSEYKQATPERQQEMLADMYNYLALDCYYTARLTGDLREEVINESENLIGLYDNLLIPASNALAEVELRGVKLDIEYLLEMEKKLKEDAQVSLAKIREYIEDPEYNPASVKQTHILFYKTLRLPILRTAKRGKTQDGPTSQPVIRLLRRKFPEHADLFNEIIKWRQIQKTLGTYVYGLLDRVDIDNRIRCDFLLHGTATGRTSSTNPNLQNVPDESHFGINVRKAFIPESSEWLFLEGDYSQLELRVAAHLSNDANFIQVYIDDGDLHKDASNAIFRKTELTPYERSLAKSTVFGALYDRGAESLAYGEEMDYLEDALGGTRWSLEEMRLFFKRFFDHYPQLAEWQKEQKRNVYRDQYLETQLGRLRRFPLISHSDNGTVGRQGINTPIQSLASDITLDALIRIHARFKKLNKQAGEVVAHILLTVHDSIAFECRRDYLKQAKKIVTEEMAQVPIDTVVPFKAKLSMGESWGTVK